VSTGTFESTAESVGAFESVALESLGWLASTGAFASTGMFVSGWLASTGWFASTGTGASVPPSPAGGGMVVMSSPPHPVLSTGTHAAAMLPKSTSAPMDLSFCGLCCSLFIVFYLLERKPRMLARPFVRHLRMELRKHFGCGT
jgi:hypothetical protein